LEQALELTEYGDVDSQVRSLRESGYVYFPRALDASQVEELRAAMDRLEPAAEGFDRSEVRPEGFFDKHILNCFNRDPLFLQYLDRSPVYEVAEGALSYTESGPWSPSCHVIGMASWVTGPGRPDQALHADWQAIDLPGDVAADPRVRVPVFVTTAHYYLDDIYDELGPTKFIPGSHRAGRAPAGDTDWGGVQEKSVICKAGDVVMFRSDVWHRGSANRSEQQRYLLQVHYAKRMIAQKFPPYLNRFQFDQDILDQATPNQLRLLGDHQQDNYA
jgi:ectoine hydroxylase-related dioxygenase (phytanoyl-CoA dioxygenase family)